METIVTIEYTLDFFNGGIFRILYRNLHLVSCVFKQDNPVNGEIMQERESYMFYLDNI